MHLEVKLLGPRACVAPVRRALPRRTGSPRMSVAPALDLQPWTGATAWRPAAAGSTGSVQPGRWTRREMAQSEQPGPAWKQLRVPPPHGVSRSHAEWIGPIFSLALGRQGLETRKSPRRRGRVVRPRRGCGTRALRSCILPAPGTKGGDKETWCHPQNS